MLSSELIYAALMDSVGDEVSGYSRVPGEPKKNNIVFAICWAVIDHQICPIFCSYKSHLFTLNFHNLHCMIEKVQIIEKNVGKII
jgi:hypothetical protein